MRHAGLELGLGLGFVSFTVMYFSIAHYIITCGKTNIQPAFLAAAYLVVQLSQKKCYHSLSYIANACLFT